MSKFRRIPYRVDIMLLEESGRCETNRGRAFYSAGDGLIKGKKRDQYPIPLDVLLVNHEPADEEALRELHIHLKRFEGEEAASDYLVALAARRDDLRERIATLIHQELDCEVSVETSVRIKELYGVAEAIIQAHNDFYDSLNED